MVRIQVSQHWGRYSPYFTQKTAVSAKRKDRLELRPRLLPMIAVSFGTVF